MEAIKKQFVKKIKVLDDDKINILNKIIDKINNDGYSITQNKNQFIIKKPKKKVVVDRSHIDKTTPEYKLVLKYVNIILKNINKDEIDDLTKFQGIDRIDVITDKNKQLFTDMSPKIFKYFNKHSCGYYRQTATITANCLRGMCKQLGFKLISTKRDITEDINGKKYKYTHYFYSII